MSTYARIENGVVAEIIATSVDPTTLYNPALVWEPISEAGVALGWTFSNGTFTAPAPFAPPALNAPSLSQLQAELAAIQAQITALSASGSTANTSSGS